MCHMIRFCDLRFEGSRFVPSPIYLAHSAIVVDDCLRFRLISVSDVVNDDIGGVVVFE